MFRADQIRTATQINHIEIAATLDSTNSRAIELIQQNMIEEQALIIAERQTAGRGQRSSKWWSGEGSLTFTFAFSIPNSAPDSARTRLLPIATGLAVAEAVEAQSNDCEIKLKWPNDLLINQRKFAGILIEAIAVREQTYFAVGIGINVNNQAQLAQNLATLGEPEPKFPPTSIQIETGKQTELENLLIAVVNRLQQEFLNLSTDALAATSIIDRANARLALIGENIVVESANQTLTHGTCTGLAVDGSLVLATDTGPVNLMSGTISKQVLSDNDEK